MAHVWAVAQLASVGRVISSADLSNQRLPMKKKPMDNRTPKNGAGFSCPCGKFHLFGVYVAAHWNEHLTHTCDECGRQHSVKNGKVTLIKQPAASEQRGSESRCDCLRSTHRRVG